MVNYLKNKTCCLFGHRQLYCIGSKLKDILYNQLQNLIKEGYTIFLVGERGEFDSLALGILRKLKKTYLDIEICVVITNLKDTLSDKFGFKKVDVYKNEKIIYYDIEEIYFKRKITISNRMMIDNSSMVLCYVDFRKHKSGAKSAVSYAIKNNVPIINFFDLLNL